MNIEKLKQDQKAVVRLLENSYKKGRLVHAYIFEGPRGTSKEEMALYLAMMLVCKQEGKPCMHCQDCHRVLNNSHPNVVIISPEDEMIRKEQIEQLLYNYSLTSIEDNNRVYIIKEADLLNQSAANALLKFLEEPQENIYGILITENINKVLSTIKSRSQIVSFQKIDYEEIIRRLINRGIDEEVGRILAHITSNEEEIVSLINEGVVLDIIDLVKELGVNFLTGNKSPLVSFFEKGKFLLTETKKLNSLFIDILIIFMTDLLYYKISNYQNICFMKTIFEYPKYITLSVEEISKYIEELLSYRNRLEYSINLELFYTEMMLVLAR